MSSVDLECRRDFWFNFDVRYYGSHPEQKPVDASIWELPHWCTWLGGVLAAEGFREITALPLRASIPFEDESSQSIWESDVRQTPADVYLFSPMIPNLHLAYRIADIIKAVHPSSTIIFGGVVATHLPAEIAKHASVDFVISGRGEYALPNLLRALENGADISELPQVTIKLPTGEVRTNTKRYPAMRPDELPLPLVDLFPASVGSSLRYLRIVYGLGCPFQCAFCTIQTIGQKPSYFPIERVLAEIEAYRSHYGKNHNIYFGDETFTLIENRTRELCAALSAAGNITFDCQTRLASLQDRALYPVLRNAGCRWIEVGLETLIPSSQRKFKQTTNLSRLEDTLLALREEGLPVCSFILNGLPDQTPYEMQMTIDRICELISAGLIHASYFIQLVPYPGSALYRDPEQFGVKLRHRNFHLYNEDLEPVYDTPYATAETIHQIYLRGTTEISQAMSQRSFLGGFRLAEVQLLANCGRSSAHV